MRQRTMAHVATMAACALLLATQVQSYDLNYCEDLLPPHGVQAQASPSPYTLTPVKGEDGRVTLKLDGRIPFTGFFVQGRNATGHTVGAFDATPGSRTVDCTGPGSASGIINNTPHDKSSVTLTWKPKGATGPIRFWYTVLRSAGIYWTEKTEVIEAVDGR